MFGHYEIIETIGHGGMGVVYRAHDTTLGRHVALKVLKEDLRSNSQIVARFQREGEAFATLDHPNIVHIYSVGQVGRIPYIAMEFIEGKPLSRVMKEERRIQWKRALAIGEQIADALQAAHDQKIIHRDIKPGNIMIGADDHAYVTDFGIAKVLTAEVKLTVDGTRLGTPQYMSPERCQNREITESSDIYSLGVMLFQMISGRFPYEAATPMTLIRKIVSDPPGRLRQIVPEVPADVERLIAYMLEKKPENRPKSGAELVRLSKRVREGRPLDEVASFGASLQSYRESLSTPTPTPLSGSDTMASVFGRTGQWASRIRGYWNGVSFVGKLGLIAIICAVGFGAAGFVVANSGSRDSAAHIIAGFDLSPSRWHSGGSVAAYTDESPGVQLATVQLPGFAVDGALWCDSRAVIQLTMEGETGTPGANAIVELEPGTGQARLLYPRNRLPAAGGALEVVGFIESTDASMRLLVKTRLNLPTGQSEPAVVITDLNMNVTGTLIRVSDFQEQLPELSPQNAAIGGVSYRPDAGILTVAVSPDGNSWALIVSRISSRSAEGRYEVVHDDGSSIDGLTIPTTNGFVLYARRGTTGSRIIRRELPMNDPIVGEAQTLLEGPFSVSAKAIGPNEDTYLILQEARPNRRVAVLMSFETGKAIHDFGPAASAQWHPSGESVVLTAPDRRGRLQLWLVDASDPASRTQLTYLESGVRPNAQIDETGTFALAPLPTDESGARVALVDIRRAEQSGIAVR